MNSLCPASGGLKTSRRGDPDDRWAVVVGRWPRCSKPDLLGGPALTPPTGWRSCLRAGTRSGCGTLTLLLIGDRRCQLLLRQALAQTRREARPGSAACLSTMSSFVLRRALFRRGSLSSERGPPGSSAHHAGKRHLARMTRFLTRTSARNAGPASAEPRCLLPCGAGFR
jgi:hypothetical protein